MARSLGRRILSRARRREIRVDKGALRLLQVVAHFLHSIDPKSEVTIMSPFKLDDEALGRSVSVSL